MARRVINITDKLSNEKPVLVLGEKEYPINCGIGVIFEFQELVGNQSEENIKKALVLTLGEEGAKDFDFKILTMNDFKVIITAIMAAVQEISYEEAEARFQL